MSPKTISAFGIAVLFVAGTTSAQQPSAAKPRRQTPAARLPGAVSVQEATEVTNGWALLAEGQAAQAAARAARVLAAHPRSGAALTLAIEAEIARVGSTAALDQYERWLGRRPLDEPAAVRRIAHALLREEAAQRQDAAARREALEALAEEGEGSAAKELARATTGARKQGNADDDGQSVNTLIAQLDRHGDDVRTIEALGASGSQQAVQPLVRQLNDGRIEVRGAAAEALGRIGDRDAIASIKPMLSDRNIYVRVKAAGALLRLDDDSSLPMLQGMLLDASADTRLAAAEALASRADAAWLVAVRQLTEESDPAIRAAAARLLAPQEPEVARPVLQSLVSDENAAVRELASQGLSEAIPDDLPSLRGLLRSPTPLTRVRAARRVLTITR
jgi:HEAT repeat protein